MAEARIKSASISPPSRSVLTPRNVFMVRSPSGVTRIRDREVAALPETAAVRNSTFAARMSWLKIRPNSSSETLPINAPRPPNEERPTIVLAADPPEISIAGPMSE